MRHLKNVSFCLSLSVFLALSPAFSAQVAVGGCTGLANYTTIQQAIDNVPAGSIVKVCPGNYHEQLSINKQVTIMGVSNSFNDAVVILPPDGGLAANAVDVDNSSLPIAAQIFVHDTSGPVSISNLTVDGTGNAISGCAPELQGVLFQNASGTLNHIAVRNETLGAGLGGCQSGQGIFVETGPELTSAVTVENSSVHSYNKNGITGHDAGTTLIVTGNYVQGNGVVPSGGAAQNGIELAFGATGRISNNTVIDNIYGDTSIADSTDILLYDAAANSGIMVNSNTVGNSQIPIGLFTDTPGAGDGVTVTGNKIFGSSTADSIDVCTNGNNIKSNTIFNSAEAAIHLDASCGATGNSNTVSNNIIVESACAGILADSGTSGNSTSPDTYYTVPFTVFNNTSRCTIPPGPTGNFASITGLATSSMKIKPAR